MIWNKRYTNIRKQRRKSMKKNAEKPDTLTAGLYIMGFLICGYFIIETILRL